MTKWKLVPVEPSGVMLVQGGFADDGGVSVAPIYRAMIAAAPKPSEDEALEQRISDIFNAYDSETDDPVLFARAVLKALEG